MDKKDAGFLYKELTYKIIGIVMKSTISAVKVWNGKG